MLGQQFNKNYFSSHTYEHVSFAKYSQYWWSNRYYAMIIRRYTPTGGRVLEIGCGLGHLLGNLEREYHTTGIDVNRWAVEQAKKYARRSTFKPWPAERVNEFPKQYFDVVIAKHVLEHLAKPELVLRSIHRITKPGGWILAATPNPNNLFRPLKGDQWIGLLDPTHISLKAPQEWKRLTEDAGFTLVKMWSDGFWNVPYIPFVYLSIQKVLFGSIGGFQALFGLSFLPVLLGESAIILAQKKKTQR